MLPVKTALESPVATVFTCTSQWVWWDFCRIWLSRSRCSLPEVRMTWLSRHCAPGFSRSAVSRTTLQGPPIQAQKISTDASRPSSMWPERW